MLFQDARHGVKELNDFNLEGNIMNGVVEVSVDNQGRIKIPEAVRNRLGLSPGTRLIFEEGERGEICLHFPEASPVLVHKEGVLVIRAVATGDLRDVVRRERDQRLSDLVGRSGL
jgi:AbrB family looped-hinge helix DNA binding protein